MRKLHLIKAHALWEQQLLPNDIAIDATAGNGHDALYLAKLLPSGILYAMDIQKEALQNTQMRLNASYLTCQVHLIHQSHESFPNSIAQKSVQLIVYNLGYLPGGNKSMTTKQDSTLNSLKHALTLLKLGGALSIMLYPGHTEGELEAEEVLKFASQLSSLNWEIQHYTWGINPKSPSLLWIKQNP